MKKLFSLIMAISLLIINLVGCGTQKSVTEVKDKAKNATEQAKNDVMQIPKNLQADMGTGTFYISTPSGTSQNGAVPVIYADKNTQIEQIGVNTSGFNGKNLSYIFVDGMLNAKEQLAESQSSINLKGNALKVGKHKVDVVQYNNNKTTDSVITHKTAYYEVKSK
ncbi:hypothetical protein [Clostridium autoethanogenum]|uniref:Lipoprotein n=1 Tax=Clostridium autoethanogenum DSM 10061 TaxID=1341692 RepID=A0ABN4BBP3_9CLOT|nr:hypothetical protein [Clostridium autoethanogenum]AGY74908.1 hypothetical protein CAETHG_0679 [Clostridium autoethanogenum DSM 10061]ALU35085.1 putative secreted protein [Clostridium autoethanogenum DSM 10061]OVY49416.1 hypothetical protein WX72_03766 [Clostridium autoethanogenum]